jgi:hypothetical protein
MKIGMRALLAIAVVAGVACGTEQRPQPAGSYDWLHADAGAGSTDEDQPLDPRWPTLLPLPPEFDLPPWVNLPAPDRIVVSWRTSEATRGGVRFHDLERDEVSVVLSPVPAYIHHVGLGEIPPGTPFEYEVFVDDTAATRAGVFVTPGRSDWRFMHIAEFHAPTNAANVARFTDLIRAFRPHVLVESGDMADNGDNFEHWRSYLRTSAPWISNVISLPAHSNHVNGFQGNGNFETLFALPGTERWYRTRYGQVEFFTLDSTFNGVNPDIASVQLDWLRSTPQRDAAFRIAAWHYPACSSHYASRASERDWVMQNFVDTFASIGGVDLILVGHDKYYERSIIDGHILHVQTATGKLAPSVAGDNQPRCRALSTRTDTRNIGLYWVSADEIGAVMADDRGLVLDTFAIEAW